MGQNKFRGSCDQPGMTALSRLSNLIRAVKTKLPAEERNVYLFTYTYLHLCKDEPPPSSCTVIIPDETRAK